MQYVAEQVREDREAVSRALTGATSREGARDAVQMTLGGQRQAWEDVVRNVFATVAVAFTDHLHERLIDTRDLVVPGGTVNWSALYVEEYLRNTVPRRATGYLGLEMRRLIKVLDSDKSKAPRRVQPDEGPAPLFRTLDELFDLLLDEFDEYIEAIESTVLTDVSVASNLGMHAGAKSLGVEMVKIWHSIGDNKTRIWHLDADNLAVGLDDSFDIDGELLLFPGDDSLGASARNLRYCRCGVTYDLAG